MRGYVKRVSQKAEKLSKEQLLSLLDDLADENESLYSLFDSLSDGIIIVDNDFCLIRHNFIAESRIPFYDHLEEVRKQRKPIWDYIADTDIVEFLKNCADKEITNSTEEFSTVTSGGSIRFISITISPLVHKHQLIGKIIFVNDITEKKNQDVLLHRMENLASLTNLAAGMAHEIKNPLGAISIHIQLIQKAINKARENENILPPRKFVENHIDVVNEEIEHLNKLVMDFLLAVRPVKATLELKDPGVILKNIVAFFTPEFNKAGIEVIYTPAAEQKRIMIDEKLFRDIIINLSQNALAAIKIRFDNYGEYRDDSSENGSGIFRIECKLCDNKYIIKIIDNGCGMTEETLSKIFEPYYTTKANGTGLGMTMVYKVVKEFAGEILVDSEIDRGTEFTLSFPIPQKDAKLLSDKARSY